MEGAELEQFEALTDQQRRHSRHAAALLAHTEVALEPFVIGMSCVFLYTAVTVLNMRIEEIGLFLVIALRLLPVIKAVLTQWQSVLGGLGAIEAVESRLQAMDRARELHSGTVPFQLLKQHIEFKNVVFSYPGSVRWALNIESLRIPAGKLTAIVGPSGGGKSTFVDMLPKLRRPQQGDVRLDNISIEAFELESLRNGIAYAPQHPQIFDGTVVQHIRYGMRDASDEQVEQAARLAFAHDFIENLPNKYNTLFRRGCDTVVRRPTPAPRSREGPGQTGTDTRAR